MTTTNNQHTIIMYTKPGCHLCDEALEMIDELREGYTITVEQVNITQDADLMRAYQYSIPVLLVDKRVTLTAPITPDALRTALDGQ